MKIVIQNTDREAASVAARHVATVAGHSGDATLGLATGSSPQPLYLALTELVDKGEADFGRAKGFALDEYVGIAIDHPESYHSIIARDAVVPLGMNPALVRVPQGIGSLEAVDAAAEDYDEAIRKAGGVDLQILGIGANGHIGFNEPGSPRDTTTRRVDLAPETVRANSRFFDTILDVPVQAVSQGLSTIMSARTIVLVANGEGKAKAIRAALEGPVSESCPASILQEHADVTFYLDTGAASLLGEVTRHRSETCQLSAR